MYAKILSPKQIPKKNNRSSYIVLLLFCKLDLCGFETAAISRDNNNTTNAKARKTKPYRGHVKKYDLKSSKTLVRQYRTLQYDSF